jgi:hypothetical protein
MKETCSLCGHSYRNHGIDGCYFQYYDELGVLTKRCSCKRNEFEEYDMLEKKLEIAMNAIRKAERLLDSNLGFRSQEDIDAWNILQSAITEIEKIK